jgi:hypothetical protein
MTGVPSTSKFRDPRILGAYGTRVRATLDPAVRFVMFLSLMVDPDRDNEIVEAERVRSVGCATFSPDRASASSTPEVHDDHPT